MIMHVSSTTDAGQGKTRISLLALQPVAPVADKPGKPALVTPYPGFKSIGVLSFVLSAEDAAAFSLGSEFDLVKK
jgi:hypothetical protein